MIHRFHNVLLIGFALSLGSDAAVADQRPKAGAEPIALGDDLKVREVAPGYWVHVAWANDIPANGLIAKTATGVVLVDPGWNDDQAERLVAWAEKTLGKPVAKAIVTHSHNDRSGGADALRRRGVPVLALDLTVAKAKAEEKKTLDALPEMKGGLYVDPMGFEVFYPGAGHTKDNIVVGFPADGILFGGCLVKPEDSKVLGNIADADLASWPKAIAAVTERYGKAKIVIPGHGPVGGPLAFQRTLDLLRERPKQNE